MTLIPLNEDKTTISNRFRKSKHFALIGSEVKIFKNTHKASKSNEFFEYFRTLNVKKLYIKALGYKTFLKLLNLNIEVFLTKANSFKDIQDSKSIKLTKNNAKIYCTLGHKK